MNITDINDKDSIKKAADIISKGGILIFPTDTVYGIGCGLDDQAILKLYKIKNRPMDKPTAVLLSEKDIPENIKIEFGKYSKGQVTIISDKKNYNIQFPDILIKENKIGVRVPDDKWLQKVIEFVGPIVASSANLAGYDTPKNYSDISEEIKERSDLIIKSDTITSNKASVVYDLETQTIIRL